MIRFDIDYTGELHCTLRHDPSGAMIVTDAPTDNLGKGEAFSPTDLFSASLGACMATTMGIFAQKNRFDLKPFHVVVHKEMTNVPSRRVGRILVDITLGHSYPPEQLDILRRAAETCPVKESMSKDVVIELNWR